MHNITDIIKSLPKTRKDVDWKNRGNFYLPSVNAEDSKTLIPSQEDFVNWINDFKSTYDEEPKIHSDGKNIIVTNPNFTQKQEKFKTGKADFLSNIKEMKKSEFAQKIKEQILSSLSEKKKKEDTEEVETTVDTEETASTEEAPAATDFGVDPKIQTLQNALKAAYDSAKELGDEKLLTQIGNTITYFTRAHVVTDKGNVAESLKKLVKEVIKQKLNK